MWIQHRKLTAGLCVLALFLLTATLYLQGALVYSVPLGVLVVLSVPVAAVLRVRNAELTEMQLFKKYWPVWVGLAILIVAATGLSIVGLVKAFLERIGY
jgi:hypothetical protein